MKIVLSGEKVVLRDITEADDREHLNWNGPYKPLSPVSYEEFAIEYREDVELTNSDVPRRCLMVEIDGELKGKVGRYWVAKETNWFEIGIVICDSRYWSGGYGPVM